MKKTETHPARDLGFLSRLHDGELAADERALFEQHRGECASCAATADEFEAALELYRRSQDAEPDAGLPARLARSIDAQISQPKLGGWIPTKLDLVWASVVIVCLAGAILVYSVARTRESRQLAVDSLPVRIESERLARNKVASEVPAAPAPPASAPKTIIAGGDLPRRPLARQRETGSQPPVTADRISEKKLEKYKVKNSADAAAPAETERAKVAAAEEAPLLDQRKDMLQAGPSAAPAAPRPTVAQMAVPADVPAAGATGFVAPGTPVRLGPGITSPTIAKRVEPRVDTRRGAVQSSVVAEIVVDEKGDVGTVRIVRSDDPAINGAVAAALKAWKFHPAMRNGSPVSVYFDVEVRVDPR